MAEKKDKKLRFLIEKMKLDEATALAVMEISRVVGTRDYSVWIAREVKKDRNLLNRTQDFTYIVDWARKTRPNILGIDFPTAMQQATEWHDTQTYDGELVNEKGVEDEKVLYRCKDGKHFFTLLEPGDLRYEGQEMGHCVGGYGDKVRSGNSIIVSLRDDSNEPHVTIEFDTRTGSTIQIRGKGNAEPTPKYQKLITEYALYVLKDESLVDKELLKLLDL